MSQAATEAATEPQVIVHVAEEASSRGIASILQPGQSATVYTGADNATFRISLTGTIQRNARIEVTVDNVVAATLSFDFRSTIVNGRSISVTNRGRDAQGFTASLISIG